jgi:hypothetical protein
MPNARKTVMSVKMVTYLNKHPFRRLSLVPENVVKTAYLPDYFQRCNEQEQEFVAGLKNPRCWSYGYNADIRIGDNVRMDLGF